MPPRPSKKRLGKKHRQASTRPKKGAAPRRKPTTGARVAEVSSASPKGRKKIASDRRKAEAKRHIPTQSPERESRKTIDPDSRVPQVSILRPGKKKPGAPLIPRTSRDEWDDEVHGPAEAAAWSRAESLASEMSTNSPRRATDNGQRTTDNSALPLVAIVGRPNVGKSTLFNRLTGSRRSIVGDEPGITRDRIYADLEWLGREARLVDTGGVLPDDPELIPAEIFRQARTALAEAAAVVMVVDGRTELAAPDLELARLLLRSGKPVFLAVNKIDTAALAAHAEDFRRLGFANIIPISAEHAIIGIGDLLDAVFRRRCPNRPNLPLPLSSRAKRSSPSGIDEVEGPAFASELPTDDDQPATHHPRHAEHIPAGRRASRSSAGPNVGKSTLLNALTGTELRAIVSPIAGTTRATRSTNWSRATGNNSDSSTRPASGARARRG